MPPLFPVLRRFLFLEVPALVVELETAGEGTIAAGAPDLVAVAAKAVAVDGEGRVLLMVSSSRMRSLRTSSNVESGRERLRRAAM